MRSVWGCLVSFDLPTDVPLSHLLRCPQLDLQNHQLRKLSEAKNLRKRVMQLLEDWIAAEALALLCEIVQTERAVMAQLAIPFPQESPDVPHRVQAQRHAFLKARNSRHRNHNRRKVNLEDVA